MVFYMYAIIAVILTYALLTIRRRGRRRSVRGKHVWVVGASRGLGHATANELARRGAKVSTSSRTTDKLQMLHKCLGPNSGKMAPLDITSPSATMQKTVSSIEEEAGTIDIVILNAAINHANKPFVQLTDGEIDNVIDTNLRAVMQLARLTLPRLRETNGVLCVVSSQAGYRGVPGASVYGASKAAITTFCQSLAVELYNDGVDIVCVHPGFVDTPAIRGLQHPKPFQMSEGAAADCVVDAVEMRESHVGFPWPMENIVLPFARHVPTKVYNFILSRVA